MASSIQKLVEQVLDGRVLGDGDLAAKLGERPPWSFSC
jgi:hypothetical protein